MGLFPDLSMASDSGIGYIVKSALLFPQPPLPLVAPAWTLSYELLFYALFGIGLWYGWRTINLGAAIWGGLILFYALAPLAGVELQRSSYWLGFLLNERNVEFLLGCIAAAIVIQRRIHRRWLQLAVIVGVILLVGWATYINMREGREVASFTATFGVASFLIVLGLAGLELRSPFRLPRGFIFLGDASYSTYLTQLLFLNFYFVLIRLTRLGEILHPFWLSCLGIAFTLVGGSMCYWFLEKPLLAVLKQSLLTPPAPSDPGQPAA